MATVNLAQQLIAELAQYQDPIQVIDIGSYPISGAPETYAPLLPLADHQLLQLTAFDPQTEVCDFINQNWSPLARAFPYAIGDGRRHTLYKTANPVCYSIYPPNEEFMDLFVEARPHFQVIDQEEIQTHALNDIPEITGIDFLKLDVQGAELDILENATKWLKQTVLIHCEVEFIELYKGQPLFETIVAFLRSQGFHLHRFEALFQKNFAPYKHEETWKGQNYFGDGIFVKSWSLFPDCTPLQLLKLAIIMHVCYSSISLAALALKYYQEKVPASDLYSVYLQATLNPLDQAG